MTCTFTSTTRSLLFSSKLDSHEYWQLGDRLPRRNGFIFIPGDQDSESLWEGIEPDEEQRDSIAEIQRCRRLAARLAQALQARH